MRVFLFDIDGTLILSGGAGGAAMLHALTTEFGVARPEKVVMSGRTDRSIARDLFRNHGIDNSAASWDRFIAAYLSHLPAFLATHGGVVLPGIAGLLEQLAGRNDAIVGLLTGNTRRGAKVKLGHYRIDHFFQFGGYGDDHFERDDVAKLAHAEAERHLDCSVGGCDIWVIGDTPLDIRCARAIGAKVAAVATGGHTVDELAGYKPDLLFENLSEPSALLG